MRASVVKPSEVTLKRISLIAINSARWKACQAASEAADNAEAWVQHHEAITASQRMDAAFKARLDGC